MQVPDIETAVTPAKAFELLPMPYRHVGLTVQGASPTRLTPYPNPNVYVAPETIKAIGLRSLVRLFTEGKTAIARVGLGLRPAARTVSGHVQAAIFFAGLARKVAYSPERPTLTPKPVPHSDNIKVTLNLPNEVAIPLDGYSTDGPFEVGQDLSDTNEDMEVEL